MAKKAYLQQIGEKSTFLFICVQLQLFFFTTYTNDIKTFLTGVNQKKNDITFY